jgi:hypothetical protein
MKKLTLLLEKAVRLKVRSKILPESGYIYAENVNM